MARAPHPNPPGSGETRMLDLREQFAHLLEESRVVMPGINALFGFQLIAIFNVTFLELPKSDQRLHLAATAMTILALSLAMSPAAYHRQVEPDRVTEGMTKLTGKLLTLAWLPLLLSLSLDFYILCRVILDSAQMARTLAVSAGLAMMIMWYVFPRFRAAQAGRY